MNYGFSSHHLLPFTTLSEPSKLNTWQKTVTALHDIPDPDNLLPGIRIAWWIWAFTTIVIIALAWLIKTKRKQDSRVSHVHDNSYQSCREELIVFREQLTGLPLADVATRCSLTLRAYMRIHIDDRALYETHDEFLLRPEALEHLPRGARDKLAPFLSKLALCKYGPSKANQAASEEIIEESLQILQGLESTRKHDIA